MKYAIEVTPGFDDSDLLEWFNGLPSSQKEEYANLEDIYWSDDSELRMGILEDWIEDHGGDRNWCVFVLGITLVR